MSALRDVVGAVTGGLIAIGGGLIGTFGLGPLVDLLASTSGLLSTLFIFGGRWVLPGFGLGGIADQAVLAGGIVVVVVTIGQLVNRAHQWATERRK